MTKRNRIYSDHKCAVVGIPVSDNSGKDAFRALSHKELMGECRTERTGKFMRHQDGRMYEDVKIFACGDLAEEIAMEIAFYLPDNPGSIGSQCEFCGGDGCQNCCYSGFQGV